MSNTESLIKSLSANALPIRPASHPYRIFIKWVVCTTLYVSLLLFNFHLRSDLAQKLHAPLFAGEIGALILVIIVSLRSAALLSFPDMMQKRGVVLAPALSCVFFLLILLLAWHADNPPAPMPAHEMECTLCITLFALLPGIMLFSTIRRLASTHIALSGSIATLAAFSLGALTLRLSEQTDSILHIVQWHYLPMLIASIIGVWIGKAALRW